MLRTQRPLLAGPTWSGVDRFPECLQGAVGVEAHVQLGAHDPQHRAVAVDHERAPLVRQETPPRHTEAAGDGPARIGEQREAQGVGVIELQLPINLIGADSHDAGAEFGELFRQVAEITALARSTRGHRLWVEVHHHGTRVEQVAQIQRVALLVQRLEVGRPISYLHRCPPEIAADNHYGVPAAACGEAPDLMQVTGRRGMAVGIGASMWGSCHT